MQNTEAWRSYRSAFDDFSLKATRVQSLVDQSDTSPAAMETALLEMERARRRYADARDSLARQLAPALPPVVRQWQPSDIHGIAELLWQVAGRPEGTAHQDWFRAEEIARRAAA